MNLGLKGKRAIVTGLSVVARCGADRDDEIRQRPPVFVNHFAVDGRDASAAGGPLIDRILATSRRRTSLRCQGRPGGT